MTPDDQQYLDDNAHIPSSEVRQDIQDTQEEINRLQQGKAMSFGTKERIDHMRAQAARDGIAERQKFINDLQRLLRLRGEEEESTS